MRKLRSTIRVAVCLLGLLAVAWSPSVFADGPLDAEGRLVNFERDIAPILRDNCLECHNEDEAKADFRIDDPESVFSYVEAGDLESSTMYTDYLVSDDPDYVMPPDGHLPAKDLSLIRVWIEEGAHWPEGATVAAVEAGAEEEKAEEAPEEAPTGLVGRVWAFQGFFHPATVHFPIALFLFGAFFVVVGWFWKSLGDQIPLACLLLGAPSAIVASAMGFSFADERGYGSWTKINMDSELFWHRWSGVIVAVVATVFAVVALKALKSGSERLTTIWKFGLLVTAAMVGLVGHQGGEIHYGEDFYPRAFEILLGPSDAEEAAPMDQPADDPATEADSEDAANATDEAKPAETADASEGETRGADVSE